MRRCIPAILVMSLFLETAGTPSVWAQKPSKSAVSAGAWIGGLTGTYTALVCYGKDNCTPTESWAVLGIYTGVGIGTAIVLEKVQRNRKPSPGTPPPGFSHVQTLVKPGDRIAIRDSSGNRSEGIVESVSDSELRLRTGNSNRGFFESDVAGIYKRRHVVDGDALIPGVLMGLTAGAVAIPTTNSGNWCGGKGAGTCVVGSAALGGAVFLGLSALPKREHPIFVQNLQPRRTGIDLRVAPMISKDTRGASMSIKF